MSANFGIQTGGAGRSLVLGCAWSEFLEDMATPYREGQVLHSVFAAAP